MKTKTEAAAAAAKLVKRLGAGWRPRVWQNLGWHFAARKGPISVYPSLDGQFHCLIAETDEQAPAGSGYWSGSDTKTFDDPRKAVEHELKKVAAFVTGVYNSMLAATQSAGYDVIAPLTDDGISIKVRKKQRLTKG